MLMNCPKSFFLFLVEKNQICLINDNLRGSLKTKILFWFTESTFDNQY